MKVFANFFGNFQALTSSDLVISHVSPPSSDEEEVSSLVDESEEQLTEEAEEE